jgi:hypothetical protein
MYTNKNYDTETLCSTVQAALTAHLEYDVPMNLLIQKYNDAHDSKEYWEFIGDNSQSCGIQVLPLARERQLLNELNDLLQADLYYEIDNWVKKVAREIELNWNEANSIEIETELFDSLDDMYGFCAGVR